MRNLKPQIETALGADRYADFLQATENGSDKLNRLMARLNLPLSTAGKITSIRQDISDRVISVRADSSLDESARTAQLANLAEEAKAKITATLGGTRSYDAYEDLKGDWIRALQPKTSPTAKP